jgi:hypothetical protein
VLTSRGRELFPVIVSLIEFGLLLQGDSRRLEPVHDDGCGAPIVSQVQCAQGHVVPLAHTEARITKKKH